MNNINLNFIHSMLKNPFGLSIFYFQHLKSILQVLQTSTDPGRKFSASFKTPYFQQD
jgi:hypothetical protein